MSKPRAIGRPNKTATTNYIVLIAIFLLCVNNVLFVGHKRLLSLIVTQDFETVSPIEIEFAASSSQFLVVCNNVDNSLTPIFDNFTIVRLNMKDEPPPWNATVFLHYDEGCKSHPYVKESLERRNQSPLLDYHNFSSSIIEQTSGLWVNGVHWPQFSSANDTPYLRVIHDRPAIFKTYGEVFWRMHYGSQSCSDVDFVVYREVETLLPDCLTIHFLQGVSTSMTRGIDGDFGVLNTTKILKKVVAHPNKRDRADEYEKFCSFIVRFNSTHPVYMFNRTHYDTDALVRHMFFLQLSEYKPCERITDCPGSPYTAFNCMVGYKFHIVMDNTLVDGYVSEKLFNGALGGGVPIYVGASDVGKYVNENSFIHCNVNRSTIDEMRSFYPRRPRPRPFLFNFSSTWPTEEELLLWADGYLRPQLEPCVKRVIELDSNDDEYMSVLQQPFLLNDKDIMSGSYPRSGVALAYNVLNSTYEPTINI